MRKSQLIALLLITALVAPSVISFFHKGFMITDDGGWMVIRLAAFYDALRDGQIPVRWVNTLNFGLGYPVTNFLYPGFLYVGTPIFLLVSNYILTIKILFVVSLILGPLGMYLWLSRKFDKVSSIFGALFYAYLPYHLYTTTVRGSLGEVMFLGILPVLFYAIQARHRFLISFLFGLLLISHNTLTLLFLPIIACIVFLLRKESFKNWSEIVLSLLLGLGMSLFFWIPALFDLSQTRFFQTTISDYTSYFASLNVMGIASFIFLAASLVLFLRGKEKKYVSETSLFILFGLLSLFMASILSDLLWKILPVGFIQFPFRFLAVSLVAISYLVAYCLATTKHRAVIGVICIGGVAVLSSGYLFPKGYSDFPDTYYSTNQASTTVKNEYMPKAVMYDPVARADQMYTVKGKGQANLEEFSSRLFKFEIVGQVESLTLSQLYFPGWTAYVDGIKKEISVEDDTGKMILYLPRDSKRVEFKFQETPIRLFADIISVVSFLCSVWFFIIKKYAKSKK